MSVSRGRLITDGLRRALTGRPRESYDARVSEFSHVSHAGAVPSSSGDLMTTARSSAEGTEPSTRRQILRGPRLRCPGGPEGASAARRMTPDRRPCASREGPERARSRQASAPPPAYPAAPGKDSSSAHGRLQVSHRVGGDERHPAAAGPAGKP